MAGIGIICKTPEVGVSKTRLHAAIGPAASAEMAGAFLRDVAASIEALAPSVNSRGYAIYAPEGSEAELQRYIPATFDLICRRDTTLGVVLHGAACAILGHGHDCAILVNADSPTLPTAFLEMAIAALRRPGDRAVIGPAIDGGYYLIGLKHPHPRLFEDIAWSTSRVTETTVERARDIGLAVEMLPNWYDVDDAETLAHLINEVSGSGAPPGCSDHAGGPAQNTRARLAAHPEWAARCAAAMPTVHK